MFIQMWVTVTLKEKTQIQNQCRLHELIKPIRYCIHFTYTSIHSLLISPLMLPLINCYKINIITPEITQTSNMHPRSIAMSITTVHLTATSPLIYSYISHSLSLSSLISLHHIPSYNNTYNTPKQFLPPRRHTSSNSYFTPHILVYLS